MPPFIDLLGHRYGQLVVIGGPERRKSGAMTWHCICDCGKKTTVWAGALRSGHTASCGCKKRALVHGLSTHPLYETWKKMHYRCSPTHFCHEHYYDRGIRVCHEWHGSDGLRRFIEWAETNLGLRPPGYSLDRIDNDDGYHPKNVRWATPSEQTLNQRPAQKSVESQLRGPHNYWHVRRGIVNPSCLLCIRSET